MEFLDNYPGITGEDGEEAQQHSRRRRGALFRSLRHRFQKKRNGNDSGDDDGHDLDDELEDDEIERYSSFRKSKSKKKIKLKHKTRESMSSISAGGVGGTRTSTVGRRRMSLVAMAAEAADTDGKSDNKKPRTSLSLRKSFSKKMTPSGRGKGQASTFWVDEEEEDDDIVPPLPLDDENGNPHDSPGKSSKKRGFGRIRKALLRRHSNASQKSADTPPSIASTEYSLDNVNSPKRRHSSSPRAVMPRRRVHLQPHTVDSSPGLRQSSNLSPPGNKMPLPMTLPTRRLPRAPDEDDNGLKMEAMSGDFYYEKFQWVIKTWIYFLTVVTPFGLLYWSFLGLFHSIHSTAFQQIPIWKRVSFHNLLFCGNSMGCTLKATFLARQALDSKGVEAKGAIKTPTEKSDGTPIARAYRHKVRHRSHSPGPGRGRHHRSRSKSLGFPSKAGTTLRRNSSFHQNATISFWDDVDKMIGSKKPGYPKRGLQRSSDRHRSTLEILRFHEDDELLPMGFLSSGAAGGGDDAAGDGFG